MTPAQAKAHVRNQVDEQTAKFWSDAEIWSYLWDAETQLVDKANVFTGNDSSTTTVASTQDYSVPSDLIRIDSLSWNKVKLKAVTLDVYESLSSPNYGGTLATGDPVYYYLFNNTVSLYPVPDSAQTLKYWYTKEPTELTDSSTAFSVRTQYHNSLVNFAIYKCLMKDMDPRADTYLQMWLNTMDEAVDSYNRTRFEDQHNHVMDENDMNATEMGLI